MGSEDYYFFVRPGDSEFINKGIAAINGKKVGVNKDSIQENSISNGQRKTTWRRS